MIYIPGFPLETKVYNQDHKSHTENISNVSEYLTGSAPGYAYEAVVRAILTSSGIDVGGDAMDNAYYALKAIQLKN
jgi:hypothetical protein